MRCGLPTFPVKHSMARFFNPIPVAAEVFIFPLQGLYLLVWEENARSAQLTLPLHDLEALVQPEVTPDKEMRLRAQTLLCFLQDAASMRRPARTHASRVNTARCPGRNMHHGMFKTAERGMARSMTSKGKFRQ